MHHGLRGDGRPCSRLQHGYCIRVSRRSAQATVGKGLAKGPYVAARAGVEPTTLRLKVIVSTEAPPHPIISSLYCLCVGDPNLAELWSFHGLPVAHVPLVIMLDVFSMMNLISTGLCCHVLLYFPGTQ